ncbi:MAG: PA14 domain-containing protein [Planctomycetes bacterium]|nr:PA14 domain-containing protein [Planctomycetota bacterium]
MMYKRFTSLLCVAVGVLTLTSGAAFALSYDIRIAAGIDDVEEYTDAHNMYTDSSDLEMPYEDDGNPPSSEQVIGLRFAVPIAKGAQVTKAYVEFTCDETKGGTNAVNLIIQGQLAANAPAFTSATGDVTNRSTTKAQVKWAVENWTTVGQKSQTADISAIEAPDIDQSGWAGGNALVLILSDDKSNPSKGIRCADAIEDGATNGPLLHVEVFDPAASAPSPADGAIGVIMPLLGWTKGDGAIFHNVYFGTTPDLTAASLVAPNQPFTMYYHVAGLEAGVTYYWRVDEVDAAGKVTAGAVWKFTSEPLKTYAPVPADAAAGLLPGLVLTWKPGKDAAQYQVYFGTDQAAVTSGAASVDKGKVSDTKFDSGALRASTTYYWRADVIKADQSVVPGDVWSFSTADAGPANKIIAETWLNVSGTNVTDLTNNARYPGSPDTTEFLDSWLYPAGSSGSSDTMDNYGDRLYGWLKPEQSGDYTFWIAGDDLSELWLSTDGSPTNGVKIAQVTGWTDVMDWDGNTGSTDKAAMKSAAIKLEAGKKYFMMTLHKEGGGGDSVGVAWQGPGIAARTLLSAKYVDMFYLPPLTAFSPTPANGQVDAPQSGALSWSAGEKAQKHDVYFGADKAAVAAADASSPLYKGQQAGTSFSAGDLEWGKTYCWRVDEINAGEAESPWKGAVWSFTTANFLPVDNMESYTDDEGSRIYETWVDGWTNGTGSIAGNTTAPFAERAIVHGGRQSLPMDYDNSKTPFYSEVEQTFSPLQDWTVNGVDTLSLFWRGATANGAGKLYVAVEDSAGKAAVATDATALTTTTWTEFKVPLSSLTGVNLAKVKKLYVGVGDRNTPAAGGTGRIYIDDIRVTKP